MLNAIRKENSNLAPQLIKLLRLLSLIALGIGILFVLFYSYNLSKLSMLSALFGLLGGLFLLALNTALLLAVSEGLRLLLAIEGNTRGKTQASISALSPAAEPAPAQVTQTVAHPAGWHQDPQNPQQIRYWDGNAWTEHTRPKE